MSEKTMPELPPSYGDHCVTDSVRTMREPGYTADQTIAYAKAYAAALQSELAAAREELGEARALLQMQTNTIKDQRKNLQAAEEYADIGRKWRADSSLETWFPLTAEEMERLRANDARYRFLRDKCKREWVSDMAHNKGAPSLDIEFDAPGHDLDAAIDATLQRDRQP